MYFEIQHTIADMRPLIREKEYNRIIIPELESLQKENYIDKKKLKFLRLIGNSSIRRKTSYLPLEGESFRCKSTRAFRFTTFVKHKLVLNDQITIYRNSNKPSDRVYKGFFRNTFGVVNRFQWGFEFEIMNKETIDPTIKSNIFNHLIDGVLKIPVGVPHIIEKDNSPSLQEMLSNIIKTCTIQQKEKTTFKQYLEGTEPIIIFQLNSTDLEFLDIPKNAEKLKEYDDINVSLYKYIYKKDNLEFTIYSIVTNKDPDSLALDKIRLLRICLLRFFAEKECLIRVLNNKKYFKEKNIKDYLKAPINNKQTLEMYDKLGFKDNNCNYILSPDERNLIQRIGTQVLNKASTPFELFT